jgi:hypothetical protein
MEPTSNYSFVRRLFRGDISLAKTFWVYGVLASILLTGIIGLIIYTTEARSISQATAIGIVAFYVFCILYQIFISIAIIRSAIKYKGNKVFKWLAIVAVIIGLINLAMTTIWIFDVTENPSSAIQLEVMEMNKKLPLKINEDTQLNSVALDGKAITYDVTIFVDLAARKMDVKTFNALIAKDMSMSLCAGSDTRYILDQGFAYVFNYKDKDGNSMGHVSISKADCGA